MEKGIGVFIAVPLREQMRSFIEQGHLWALMEDYLRFNKNEYRGKAYKDVLKEGSIPVIIGSDDAPLTKWKSSTLYPVVSSFLPIPCSHRHKFPLIHAVYCGPKAKKPPIEILHKYAQRQFVEYNEDPLPWPCGTKKKLRIIAVSGDALEKAEILGHVKHGGFYSCFFCLIKGHSGSTKQVTEENNKKKTTKKPVKRLNRKVKFGDLYHKRPWPLRSEKQRLRFASIYERNLDRWKNRQGRMKKPGPYKGVKGVPLYKNLDHFDGLWCYVIDLLHTLYEGVGKRALGKLLGAKTNNPHSIFHKDGQLMGELN